jgi:hypothetical protein
MNGIALDWSIRIGDLLTVGGAFMVALGLLYNRGKSDSLDTIHLEKTLEDLKDIKGEVKQQGETIAKIAIQEVQIRLLMKWYDELRRGIGYVKGARDGIDGEYP